MATIHQQKDYWVTSPPIQPRGAYWLSWPIPESVKIGTWTLTGTPADSNSGYYTMSVKGEVHVTTRSYWTGDIHFVDFWVGASFHNTGDKPITAWYTVQTCIAP